MVEGALADLEQRGLVAPSESAVAVWEHSRMEADGTLSASSRFSGFVPKSTLSYETKEKFDARSRFSVLRAPDVQIPPPQLEPEPLSESPVRHGRSLVFRLLAGVVLLLGGLLVIVLLFPYDRFKPDLEAAAGRWLQDRVVIEKVGVVLWPRPQLVLGGLTIGGGNDFYIHEARVDSPASLLLSGKRVIPRVELSEVKVGVHKLAGLPMFGIAANPVPGIGRVRIERMQVNARDLSISDLSGDLLFKSDGHLEKTSLQTVDRSISLEAVPTVQGIALNIEGAVLAIPGTPLKFESLQAKGLLLKDRLLIQSIDAFLLGGTFKGTWLLDWSSDLVTAGDGAFRLLDSRRVTNAFAPSLKLEGDFSGNLALRGRGSNWAELLGHVEATLDVDISRGLLHGVDLGEATRKGPGSVVRAGATKFDRFLAVLAVAPGRVSARDLRLESGMMTAAGQFSAKDRQVDAALMVTLQTSVSTLRIPLHVQGQLPELSVVNGK
ncbi:hypothetical protein [Dechloromonas sp. TW-R-39-2]|uniref:hypothetical protein n=1 Tax=Dechloromonas sp. TW-R-39-2 TaxID=2654218 RepID=UPI00193D3194|nr:hypothetical protein [Dechloromonas sp. TW-R-39-2]